MYMTVINAPAATITLSHRLDRSIIITTTTTTTTASRSHRREAIQMYALFVRHHAEMYPHHTREEAS